MHLIVYLGRVIDDDGFPEIATKNVEVFDVIAVYADAVLSEESAVNGIIIMPHQLWFLILTCTLSRFAWDPTDS